MNIHSIQFLLIHNHKNPLALTGKQVSPLDIKVIRISLHLWTLRVLMKLHIYFCI